MENNANSLKKTARLAGFLYLILVITGIYGVFFISLQTIVQGNASAYSRKYPRQ